MKNSAKKSATIVKEVQTNVSKDVKMSDVKKDALDKLNALNISEKIAGERKSIFKKEFQTKQFRTSCREKFQSAIQRYLLFLQKGNNDLAQKELASCKEIAKKFYIAEDKFQSASDYYTNGMNAEKKAYIDLFIDLQK